MPKVDGKKLMLQLNGEKVYDGGSKDPLTLGRTITNILGTHTKGSRALPVYKLYELARKFYPGKEVEIDNSDLDGILDVFKTSEGLTPLVAGQVIEHLEEVKSKK